MNKMKALHFGIIGVGNVARNHAAAIKGTPCAALVAVADCDPERARAFAAEDGGTWYADSHDLLARDDIDAVALCTPHDLHAPMTIDAAAAHKHNAMNRRNPYSCRTVTLRNPFMIPWTRSKV